MNLLTEESGTIGFRNRIVNTVSRVNAICGNCFMDVLHYAGSDCTSVCLREICRDAQSYPAPFELLTAILLETSHAILLMMNITQPK